jgi:hypothetical protein
VPGKHYHSSVVESISSTDSVPAKAIIDAATSRPLDNDTVKVDVNGEPRKQSKLSGQEDAPEKQASDWYGGSHESQGWRTD